MIAQATGATEYTHYISGECLGYDTKQFDGETPIMLELWGMWSIPSLQSLPGPLWPRKVAPDTVLPLG